MRLREFSSEADSIKFIKFEFEKVLRALGEQYKKRLKIAKNKQRIAKKKIKSKKLRSLRNDSWLDVNKPVRPKR